MFVLIVGLTARVGVSNESCDGTGGRHIGREKVSDVCADACINCNNSPNKTKQQWHRQLCFSHTSEFFDNFSTMFLFGRFEHFCLWSLP